MGSEIWYCLSYGMSDGKTMESMDKSHKTHNVNAQDVKITYPVNELIKCLPEDKAFGCAAKKYGHTEHLEDLHCSLNPSVLPDISDHNTRSHSSTTDINQTTCNIYDLTSKSQSSCAQTDQPLHSSNHAHTYNLCLWKAVGPCE